MDSQPVKYNKYIKKVNLQLAHELKHILTDRVFPEKSLANSFDVFFSQRK